MTPEPFVFLSHTTADVRDAGLAHRLAAALEQRGARVWIAPDSIAPGSEWSPEIVGAVLQRCSHFLVIVSAASITSEWVLKEIDLARERSAADSKFVVLPLFTGRVPAFPGKDFLSALQWLAYCDDFHAQADAAARAIGLHAPIPHDIEQWIADRTRDFVGRMYIFDAISQFLVKHPSGYLTIIGDPGAGKTAIVAEFVKRTGAIAHFNIRTHGITTPRQFLDNICTRVAERFGLPFPAFSQNAPQDAALMHRLLKNAASGLAPDERILIAVDALDEAETRDQPPGTNVLFLPENLPRQVYFIVTRRDVSVPLSVYAPSELLNLADYKDLTREDVKEYLQLVAARPTLAAWINERNLTQAVFVEQLIDKSECNFMYLHYIVPALETGPYRGLAIAALPQGLEGYYERHWERMGMNASPLPRVKIKIIYVLCEVRQPVSRMQIVNYCREDALTVQEVLDEWTQFLHRRQQGSETFYSIYHTSFADFLHRKDIVQAAGDAGVTVEAVNGLIGSAMYANLYGNRE